MSPENVQFKLSPDWYSQLFKEYNQLTENLNCEGTTYLNWNDKNVGKYIQMTCFGRFSFPEFVFILESTMISLLYGLSEDILNINL